MSSPSTLAPSPAGAAGTVTTQHAEVLRELHRTLAAEFAGSAAPGHVLAEPLR